MGTFSKIILSGSTDAIPFMITAVAGEGGAGATDGNLIHQSITGGADAYDEVYVYGFNSATAARNITMRWGASGDAGATTLLGRNQTFSIPAKDGDYLLVPGHMMREANRLYAHVTVAGTVSGGISVHGWVNRFAS